MPSYAKFLYIFSPDIDFSPSRAYNYTKYKYVMRVKALFSVFIDGSAGTTGLRIRERLAARADVELLELAEEERKDAARRKWALNACDAAILCLPDAAAREAVSMVENERTVVLDASTAHRTAPGWAYGLPELGREALDAILFSKRVDVRPILDVLEKGYIPVVSTVGCDMEGNTYNINADTAAARIAGELGAACLVTMTDVAGILRDREDPDTLIRHIDLGDVPRLIETGVIAGGMIPKAQCCTEAIRRGVKKVFIIDGRVPHAVLIELLTDEGLGTMFEE